MTNTDREALRLGHLVIRMIRDLAEMPQMDAAYGYHRVTYPGGAVGLFVTRPQVSEIFHRAARQNYENIVNHTMEKPPEGN